MKKKLFFGSNKIASLKRVDGGICLDGKQVYTNVRVRAGEVLSVIIEDVDGFNPAPPVDIPLSFFYEDEYLVVLNKQAGLATQGPPEIGDRTVAGAISFLWGREKSFHPISRLDRGTSGLMLIAKNGYVHDRLRRQLHTEELCRKYLAVVRGIPHPPAADIDLPIKRENEESLKRIIADDGKPSLSHYVTLETKGDTSLVEVTPYTGRTHQIRVHMSAIGHPIIGDWLYGEETEEISRPALHSYLLTFLHPISGKILTFTSSLPSDMELLWKKK